MADLKTTAASIALGIGIGAAGVEGSDALGAKLEAPVVGVSFYLKPDGTCGGDLEVALAATDAQVKEALPATRSSISFVTGPCDPAAIATAAGAKATGRGAIPSDITLPIEAAK